MRKRGVQLDPLRLQEQLASQREREKLEHKQHLTDIRSAASAVVKARRALELATGFYKQKPTSDNLAVASAAKADLRAAQEQLLELCHQDEGMAATAVSKAQL
jgi:hypothetical protein